ncbi:MAG: hypothetical protein HY526_05970 [Betaproteobacteria bacterium]|nr:hypothetical protein [Betaproteobacteria bacterium]
MTRKHAAGNRKKRRARSATGMDVAGARDLRELPKKKGQPGQPAGKAHNKLALPQNRWQRFVRYVWDKKR